MQKKVVAGLGNPGSEYENTYHNAGFLALSELAKGNDWKKHKDFFEYTESDQAIFIRPLTFMNESGRAIREALKKFKIKPADLIVIQDDSDITLGNYKISFARNSGGHKGVQSVIDAIGTKEFTRIRIGIRPLKELKRQKAGDFALKKISSANRRTLDEVLGRILESYRKRIV